MMENVQELSFEEALGRLEEIVADLDGGELSLDDSLKRFEEGMALKQRCLELLAQAEARVEQVAVPDGEESE
jgi:exodeoxyribonuclease VII small subunit